MAMTFYDPKPLSAETRARLEGISTGTLTTVMQKFGLKSVFMQGPRALRPDLPRMVGPAFTIRMVPAREDFATPAISSHPDYPQRDAIEGSPPGSVLCFDTRGEVRAGTIGDILMQRLKVRGVAGFVTDGALRDVAAISALDFPAFCAAPSAPPSWTHHVTMDAQLPIGCGGVTVFPGDILVGDGDGVVVVPANIVDDVAKESALKELQETFIFERISAGDPVQGTYPPNEKTLAAFDVWRKEQGR